ncbi:hypothetical protein B0T26DRAFT_134314 [Lasiosphaeria miniovina]|uniref:Uncharacterized protein n=1 Tax=Lasiosphaeria miniovina TaxID=1954250 RepID=A0AA40B483_9PEZI|nr:uncharacterized protein B0T26DRAFT_134314 [Lasiosphaeria miniovina]KAK0727406.1 hypothetical protein B0T26DRAFT_134314 [Lasiosphaeria miniovina]
MDELTQLSIPLPRSLDTRIYISLTIKAKAITLFLTTASADEAGTPTPLGSFVFALPDKYNPTQPLSTPLCTVEPTLELTTRLAKIVAKKTQLPTYVGNSISFANAGLGAPWKRRWRPSNRWPKLSCPSCNPSSRPWAPLALKQSPLRSLRMLLASQPDLSSASNFEVGEQRLVPSASCLIT